tara:strand:+ start:320 stop:619 length:300 start_codon:yes stop_codon:yes gene_type:complete
MLDHFIATYRHRSCTWEQCLQVAASYQERWHRHMDALNGHHYSSGVYIDNRADAEALHAGMNAIEKWCYSNIPAPMYDELCEVMGYTPRSTLNMFNGPD